MAGLLLITPIYKYLAEPWIPIYKLGFAVTAMGFLAGVAVYVLIRRGQYAPWIGFASSCLDVSLVSMALTLFIVAAGPMAALGSKVTFEVYFLAIAATALRVDGRISATAGGLAMAQYAGLWVWSSTMVDLSTLAPDPDNGAYVAADQVTRLILLAAATVLAILLVGRVQVLQHAASTDPLTGVGNRSHFDRRVHAEFERARRYQRHVAIALVDVDHFKRFNDVHGHQIGDSVLITVATLLGRNLRRSDVLARYGGEEFAIVLPEATLAAAASKVDLIRRTVESTVLGLPDDKEPSQLTISAGVAVYPQDGNNIDLLIAVADDRLLAAKRTGRNRVVTAEEPPPEAA